jgi:heme/copper-type cytochrome/quinol oxidase subunit 1
MSIDSLSINYLLLAHVHFLLMGFIAMMIYSVSYHVLPRFSGFNLYSLKLVTAQFYLANIGLIGIALVWIFSKDMPSNNLSIFALSFFALLEFLSVCIFVFNNIMTLMGKGGKMEA